MSAAKCGATIDASDLPCALPKDHDLGADPAKVRHSNAAGTTWASTRRKLLDAAAPALADALMLAVENGGHHESCSDTECRCWRAPAIAALRAAGRLP